MSWNRCSRDKKIAHAEPLRSQRHSLGSIICSSLRALRLCVTFQSAQAPISFCLLRNENGERAMRKVAMVAVTTVAALSVIAPDQAHGQNDLAQIHQDFSRDPGWEG